LNFKNKTSFPPLNYVPPTLKRDKKGYTTEGRKAILYGTDYSAAVAHFSAAVASHAPGKSPAPAGRVSFFVLH
jgi:hypothetical protein